MTNNNYKSFESLNNFAKEYKTTLAKPFIDSIKKDTFGEYPIQEDSLEALDNIMKFVLFSTIKNSKELDSSETEMSNQFKDLLIKYNENKLELSDIYLLLYIILTYNTEIENYFFKTPMEAIFGLRENNLDEAVYFNTLVENFKNNILNYDTSSRTEIEKNEIEEIKLFIKNNAYEANNLLRQFIFIILDLLIHKANANYNNYQIKISKKDKVKLNNDTRFLKYTKDNKVSYYYYKKNTSDSTEQNKIKEYDFSTKFDIISIDREGEPNNTTEYFPKVAITKYEYFPRKSTDPLIENFNEKIVAGLDQDYILLYLSSDSSEKVYEIIHNMVVVERTTSVLIPSLNLYNDANKDKITEVYKENVYKFISKFLDSSYTTPTTADEAINKIIKFINEDNFKNKLIFKLNPIEYANTMLQKNKILYSFKVASNNASYSQEQSSSATFLEQQEAQRFGLISGFNIINYPIIGKKYIQKFDNAFCGENKIYNKPLLSQANSLLQDSQVDQVIISLGVIYKELNPAYRKIEYSDILETYLAIQSASNNVFLNDGNIIINPRLTSIFRQMGNNLSSNNSVNELNLLISSLYVNPYMARAARESDIIQYFAGSYIDYPHRSNRGNNNLNEIEMSEIETFLDIYQETRDYYYYRLLNKSFAFDDLYEDYEKFFITFYAIERYLSSKIDNIHNIDKFDKTDIHNFLLTYGLEILDKHYLFYNADDFKLKIIKNFTELMRNKGTTDVVRILEKIFNGKDSEIKMGKLVLFSQTGNENVSADTSSVDINNLEGKEYDPVTNKYGKPFTFNAGNIKPIIDLSKPLNMTDEDYLKDIETKLQDYDESIYYKDNFGILYKLNKSSNPPVFNKVGIYYKKNSTIDNESLKFAEIDYAHENETQNILANVNNAKSYNEIVKSDPYWDETVLTEDSLKKLNINTAISKYSTFEYAKNIAEPIIKSRYALEMINYLNERFTFNENNKEISFYKSIEIKLSDNLIPINGNITYDDYFRIIRLMHRCIVKAYMNTDKVKANKINSLGINKTATYETLFANIINRLDSHNALTTNQSIKDHNNFYKHYFTAEQGQTSYNEWPNGLVINYKLDDNAGTTGQLHVFTNNKISTNMSTKSGSSKVLFNTFEKDSYDRIKEIKNSPIELAFRETISSPGSKSSYSSISSYLSGINFLSLSNEMFGLKSNYASNVIYSWYIHNLKLSNSNPNSIDDIYENIVKKILQFPSDYILAYNNPKYFSKDTEADFAGMHFNTFYKIFTDELFKTFFTTDNPIIDYSDDALSAEDKAFLNKHQSLIKFFGSFVDYDTNTGKLTIRPTDDQTISESVKKLLQITIDFNALLSNQALLNILYQFSEELGETAKYLSAAIRIFISYTSEIYKITTSQRYKSKGENLIPYDNYYGNIKQLQTDIFYYDENIEYIPNYSKGRE